MERALKRGQNGVSLGLGAWLFISPWVLGYVESHGGAAWNAYLLGAATVLFSLAGLYTSRFREELAGIAFGVWLIASPWLMGFSESTTATYNATLVGVVLAIVSLLDAAEEYGFIKAGGGHHQT
ncbi:SPW repeat protein [Pelomicrobium sp.]|jgi:thiosulfate reductase cytochrome b subunit|uniref:SPW repeat protein n=1 Tax=Pelomicrobium sp. TaxID=2815319 RepID=UPI002FDE1DE1